mmetsp:Transcript_40216/g.106703  ORF Transcript_40216/g.106703 Transcript_40216/m.106703 type:complete len:209 (+) Transcript_40216:1077-1703(+)
MGQAILFPGAYVLSATKSQDIHHEAEVGLVDLARRVLSCLHLFKGFFHDQPLRPDEIWELLDVFFPSLTPVLDCSRGHRLSRWFLLVALHLRELAELPHEVHHCSEVRFGCPTHSVSHHFRLLHGVKGGLHVFTAAPDDLWIVLEVQLPTFAPVLRGLFQLPVGGLLLRKSSLLLFRTQQAVQKTGVEVERSTNRCWSGSGSWSGNFS